METFSYLYFQNKARWLKIIEWELKNGSVAPDLPILPFLWIWPGMIPILHSPGCKQTIYCTAFKLHFGTFVICNSRMNVHVLVRDPYPNDSGTVWSYNPRFILSKQFMFHFNHIVLWDPLRDDNCKWYLKSWVWFLSLSCQSISFCLL